jgi:hypothetical protein
MGEDFLGRRLSLKMLKSDRMVLDWPSLHYLANPNIQIDWISRLSSTLKLQCRSLQDE